MFPFGGPFPPVRVPQAAGLLAFFAIGTSHSLPVLSVSAGQKMEPSGPFIEIILMRTAPTIARDRLLELLRLTPEPHTREGYVMVLRNAVDEYVQAVLGKDDAAAE